MAEPSRGKEETRFLSCVAGVKMTLQQTYKGPVPGLGPTRLPPRVAGYCWTTPHAVLRATLQSFMQAGWVLQ